MDATHSDDGTPVMQARGRYIWHHRRRAVQYSTVHHTERSRTELQHDITIFIFVFFVLHVHVCVCLCACVCVNIAERNTVTFSPAGRGFYLFPESFLFCTRDP